MIEAERRNENGVLLSAWSVRLVAKRRDVSVARKPKPANQCIVHYSWKYVRTPRTAVLRSVGEVCFAWQQMLPTSPKIVTKLHEDIAKLY